MPLFFFSFFIPTNLQFTYTHLISFFPIFQILSDFYAFKSIGLRKPFLVLKVEYWVGLLSSKSNFFTNKISKGRKSVREKSTFLPTFAFNTKKINSRKGFFRKLHLCTFYCINSGFGGPWDMLRKKNSYCHFHNASKECFWPKKFLNFMHGFKSAILAIFHFCQNGTFEPVHEIQKNFWPKTLF